MLGENIKWLVGGISITIGILFFIL